jgi:CRP-like cAMP-binding protein
MSAPIELLKQVPLFKDLNERQLKGLASEFTERRFRDGQELTAEGSGGAGFFVIQSGTAKVTVDGVERRTLGEGDFYGEIALIDGGLRTATITATSDGTAWGLTRWQFKPLVETNGEIGWHLLEQMARRMRELEQH